MGSRVVAHETKEKIIKQLAVPVFLQFVVSLVVTTVAAWMLYRFFEKPANTLVRAKLQ